LPEARFVNGSSKSFLLDRGFLVPAGISFSYALLTSFATLLLPVYLKGDLHFSGAQIGMLYGAYGVTALVAVFPSGLSTDAARPRNILLAATALTVLAAVGIGLSRTFVPYLACFLFFGLAGHAVKIASEAVIYKTHDAARTGEVFGAYQATRMTAYAVALLGTGYLVERIGFPKTIFVFAAILASVALTSRALPDVPVAWSRLSLYGKDFRRPDVLVFATWLFLFTSHWGAETTSYALFVRTNLGLSPHRIGWFMAGEFVTFAATAWFLGKRHDRGGDLGRILLTGLLASGVGHVGMTYPWVPSSYAFRLLHGVGDGCIAVVMYVGVARLFLRERIGGNTGLINLVTMAGVLAGSLIYGPVGERFGYHVPFVASGLLLLALAAFPQARRGARVMGEGNGGAA
jgi:MFS family permease